MATMKAMLSFDTFNVSSFVVSCLQKNMLGAKIPFERIRLNGILTFTTNAELFESMQCLPSMEKLVPLHFQHRTNVRHEHESIESNR